MSSYERARKTKKNEGSFIKFGSAVLEICQFKVTENWAFIGMNFGIFSEKSGKICKRRGLCRKILKI